jgi:DNA-binding MarR family transcriptional regulator
MGEYRLLLEKLIHYCNVYSAASKKELPPMEGVTFTFSQIQVVEYLIENEETTQNMSTIANRLGITFSTFSKVVNKLEEKGLLADVMKLQKTLSSHRDLQGADPD